MRSIRGGSGLGDSLYLQSVVRHLVEQGHELRVHSDYPAVFSPLEGRVQVAPFTRIGVDIMAHYTTRKGLSGTDQFEDMCINAGINGPVDLRMDWQPRNRALIDKLKNKGVPVVCVQLPRAPMGRSDGFGKELLPDCRVIQHLINDLRDQAYIVQIGSGEPLFRFTGINLDLAGQTSVSDLIDVASVADGFIGYVSFVVPLAESLGKPALMVWSSKGLRAPLRYVRQITPKKILHKDSSIAVIDDWAQERITGALNAFRHKIGSCGDVHGQVRGDCRERPGVAA